MRSLLLSGLALCVPATVVILVQEGWSRRGSHKPGASDASPARPPEPLDELSRTRSGLTVFRPDAALSDAPSWAPFHASDPMHRRTRSSLAPALRYQPGMGPPDAAQRAHHRRASTVAFADTASFQPHADSVAAQPSPLLAIPVFVQSSVQEDGYLVRSNPVAELPPSEPASSSRPGSTAQMEAAEQPHQVATSSGASQGVEAQGGVDAVSSDKKKAPLGRPFVGSGSI